MSAPVKIGVLGAAGRMGRALLSEINKEPQAKLVAALAAPGSPHIGETIGGVILSQDIRHALQVCDVLVDFSHPSAAIDAALMMYGTPCKTLVTGTTGYTKTEEQALVAAADSITLVKSGNFSIGICVLETLVAQAAHTLKEGWDIDVLDIHHRHKKDAPSGTALMLGDAAKAGRGKDAKVEYAALRHGGVIGEHHIAIASELETLTLSHSANDRAVFAKGALTAALWAFGKPKGLYGMKDVLGL